MKEINRILSAAEQGDPTAAEQLLPLVYDELRRMAQRQISREQPGQTLQATALVHEAYLRLVGDKPARAWNGRGHFFAAAAEAMRRILIDNARRKRAVKRGGDRTRVELVGLAEFVDARSEQLLALDAALSRLESVDPVSAKLVKLRFFAGLTVAEASEQLGISASSGKRYWAYARAWIEQDMERQDTPSG